MKTNAIGQDIPSLPEAKDAIRNVLRLLDHILTWDELSEARRGNLTRASNHLEQAIQDIR